MRRTVVVTISFLLVAAGRAEETPQRRARTSVTACATTTAARDSIVAVAPDGEVGLSSARRVKIAGVRLLRDPTLDESARPFFERLRGKSVVVAPLGSGAPDRWGRTAANLTVEDGDEPVDLAGALVEAGLALVDAGPEDVLCRPALLGIEARARRDRRGGWIAGGPAGPVAADDVTRLAAAAGRFTVVEGKVHAVGERPQRTYIDLGPRGGKAATITIPKRAWLRMADRGLKAATLRDRTIRARGIVESWRGGPAIEIVAADMIELLEPSGSPKP